MASSNSHINNTSTNIFSTNAKLGIHFVGIGGIGMCGIAEACVRLGHTVSGSDVTENSNIHHLRQLSVFVTIGHGAGNVPSTCNVVVISSAIDDSKNPELEVATSKGIPVFHRSDVLKAFVSISAKSVTVTGTHGKSTTTALLGSLLVKAGLEPSIFCGGVMRQFNNTIYLPTSSESAPSTNYQSEWIVAEVDESDGSFHNFHATYPILTNINDDHMTYFQNEEKLTQEFTSYLETRGDDPSVTVQILGIDCARIYKVLGDIRTRTATASNRFLTFGLHEVADIRGMNLKFSEVGTHFDVVVAGKEELIENLFVPLHGEHNVQNALIAVALAQKLEINEEILREALGTFAGVDRRFTVRGIVKGITTVDDYAVHPKEIVAVLQAARRICFGKLIAVVQIHRQARLASLFEDFLKCFDTADEIILLPLYSPPGGSRGNREHGVTIQDLRAGLLSRGRAVTFKEDFDHVMRYVKDVAIEKDFIICLGAGNVTQLSHMILNIP